MLKYVLIGNSIAAHSAGARIHSLEPDASIAFISDEKTPFYSRCALMYYAMEHAAEADLVIGGKEHYGELGAHLIYGRARSVDTRQKEVMLEDGGRQVYDRLLIATGASPRKLGVPNEDARGIYDFFTIEDARRVKNDCHTARRAVVIGGGLIGAEVAEVFRTARLPVDYLVREDRFYPRFCSIDQSHIIARRFQHHGIGLHLGCDIAGFEKDSSGRVSAVLDDKGGRHPADLVVRAIGVKANVGFLEGSGVSLGAGVIVDGHMKATAPDIWAAGDCTEIHLAESARPLTQRLWYTAQPQGWVAGENMAGGNVCYKASRSYQAAMFLDLDFCAYGEASAPGDAYGTDSLVARNGIDSLHLVHDGEYVVGASFLGKALVKDDLELLVDTPFTRNDALQAAERALAVASSDRAPRARLAAPATVSRRPHLWPFGNSPWRRGWRSLTGGL